MSEPKKILHIIPESMQLEQFMVFMEDYYDDITHDFIITDFGGSGEATRIKEHFFNKYNIIEISTFRIKDVPTLCKRLRKSKEYDNIIFHSLYLNYLLLALLFNIKAVRRATMIVWGIQDGGPFTVPEAKSIYKIHGWLYEKLRSFIIPEFRYICTMIESDYKKVKKLYNVKGGNKKSGYIMGKLENDEIDAKKRKDSVNIQVGHAGFELTFTIEALEALRKFKDENIRVFSPLSYGNDNYISEVIQKGKEIFGSKFISITKQISHENYVKFVSYMDIYVHNATGQMGLANIDTHIANFNKLYLNEKGVVYSDLKETPGYHMSRIGDICNQSFEEFAYCDSEQAKENKIKFDRLQDVETYKMIWDDILLDFIE